MTHFPEIEQIVCIGQGIAPEQRKLLRTKSRKRELVEARQLVMYFLRFFNGEKMTWLAIGEKYGKDHATAMHAFDHIEDLIDTDKKMAEHVKLYKLHIKSVIDFKKNLVTDNVDLIKNIIRQRIDDDMPLSSELVSTYNLLTERNNALTVVSDKVDEKAAS
jgi:hypothetical protein